MSSNSRSHRPEDLPLDDSLRSIASALEKVLHQQLEDVDAEGTVSRDVLNDSKASFHLGMKLFGSKTVAEIEREVQSSLRQMKQSLGSLQASSDDESVAIIRAQIGKKLQFILECSQARSTLDDSITYSTAILAPQEIRNMKQSTEFWKQAQRALQSAHACIVEMEESQPLFIREMEEQPSSSIQDCYRLYDEIHRLVRRQKLDILSEAKEIWTTCIEVSSGHLFVAAPKRHPGSLQLNDSLPVFFDISDSLAKDDDQALDDTVQSILRKLTLQLQQNIFQPMLDDMQADRYTPISFRSLSDDDSYNVSTSLKEGNRLDWSSSRETSKSNHLHVLKDLNLNDYATAFQKTRPTAASEVSRRDVTTTLQHWENITQFLRRILSFVADHVLLQNPLACRYVAQRLFGRPTNLSTILGGKEKSNPGGPFVGGIETNFSRFGDDDDGVLLQPLLETIEKTCIAPLHLLPDQLQPELNTIAQHLQSQFHPLIEELAVKNILHIDTPTYLSNYMKSIHQIYINHRHCQLLNEARDMIVSTDYHNTAVVGEECNVASPLFDDPKKPSNPTAFAIDSILSKDGLAVFKLHQASVSCMANEVMQLCRKIMEEVVEHYNYRSTVDEHSALSNLSHFSSPADFQIAYCDTMYRTAREVLDLFRAIVPMQHGKEVAQVPRTAAILHNDCVFFAHHCLTLGLQYKNQFRDPVSETLDHKDEDGKTKALDQLLRQHCMFLDMVPLFRDIADRSLSDMLAVQKNQVQELVLDRITIFHVALKSNEYLSEWSDAEMALQAGIYHIRHLVQNWKPPILAHDIFHRVIGYLVDVLLTMFLEEIEKATDISAAACPFLHSLLTNALEELDRVWEVCLNKKQYSRVWDRCQVFSLFMNMSIIDIQNSLSSGLFRSVTASELSHLITSCFDDTPKRRSLLQLISSQQSSN